MFRTAINFRPDIDFFQLFFQAFDHEPDEFFPLGPFFFQTFGYVFISIRFDKPERKVFKLPLDLPDAEPVRQWRINFECFLGILASVTGIFLDLRQISQGSHSRSQPYHHDTHIGSHCQKHFAQGFGLCLPDLRSIFSLGDLFQIAGEITQFE